MASKGHHTGVEVAICGEQPARVAEQGTDANVVVEGLLNQNGYRKSFGTPPTTKSSGEARVGICPPPVLRMRLPDIISKGPTGIANKTSLSI